MRPPIEEERKLASYPDRGIKPILCLMMSTGIRLGAFGTIQWKHIVQIIVKTVMKSITLMTGAISPETFGILGLEPEDTDQAIKLSLDIVRNDLNNAATLIRHRLLNESIFLQEYWWIVLRTWDSLKVDILARRNAEDGSSEYMLSLEKLKDKAEKYASKHHRKDFEDYTKKYRPEMGPVKGNRMND